MWFRFPEGERQIAYPFITIDFLSADPAFELFHSNVLSRTRRPLSALPAVVLSTTRRRWQLGGYNIPGAQFLPMRMTWQVSHFARNALHDRYLTSIFKTDVFPVRPFFIESVLMATWRRTERIGFTSADSLETTESGTKRIFRKIYTISMLAEIPQELLG